MPTTERPESDFGSRMRRVREARGVSLRQIADSTKLSVAALEALERNEISRLPGGIFSRAFVRSYAAEIGIDPEATVREFITHFPHDAITVGTPQLTVSLDAPPESRARAGLIALACVGVVLLASAVIYFFPNP